jgi:hypothetical protein
LLAALAGADFAIYGSTCQSVIGLIPPLLTLMNIDPDLNISLHDDNQASRQLLSMPKGMPPDKRPC